MHIIQSYNYVFEQCPHISTHLHNNKIKILSNVESHLLLCCCYLFLVIGSGILVSPGGVAARAQSGGLTIVLWVAAGVTSMLGMNNIGQQRTRAQQCQMP